MTSQAMPRTLPVPSVHPRVQLRPALLGWAFGYALFFTMLFVPTTYQTLQGVLLAGTLAAIGVGIVQRRDPIILHRQLVVPLVSYAAVGAFFDVYGLIRGNPGAVSVVTVYCFWPLVYLLLVSAISKGSHLDAVVRMLVLAGLAIGGYGLLYLATQNGALPSWLFFVKIDQQQIYQPFAGFLTASFSSLSTLLFLIPFLMALPTCWPRDRKPPMPMYTVYLALVLDVALVILSARRAQELGLVLAPILIGAIYLACQPKRPPSEKARRGMGRIITTSLIFGLGAFGAMAAFDVNISALFADFVNGFAFASPSGDIGAQVRSSQTGPLWAAFGSHPILGSGLGGVAPHSIRSVEQPWAYELSYLALLFHVGLVGFTAYVGGVAWALVRVVRTCRRDAQLRPYGIAMLSGTIAFLMGNATNPYLEKFDSLWALFIPLVVLNVARTRQREARHRACNSSRSDGKGLPVRQPVMSS